MKRRNFIKSVTAASAPFMLGGIPIGLARPMGLTNFINGDSDHILVLIRLDGGNDGLNTVIQKRNYDVLANLRSDIIIPESDYLSLDDNYALHPSMTGIRNLYDEGRVKIIQNVAYPNQNRSHFRSADIWTTASDAEEVLSTGWLGRYLADEHPGYPDGFPNDDCPDPLAITIGNFTSETCQGESTNFSIAVGDIEQIKNLDEPDTGNLPDNCYGREMEFLIESILKSNAYANRLTDAANAGSNANSDYLENDAFAEKLKTTALLISGGLKTKIYIVSLGGFDTHAGQVDETDASVGVHADLWHSISSGVSAFLSDMQAQGFGDKITCLTFSEFGRQIQANASYGTDHGTAAPMFVFGNCVSGGILGDAIEIQPDLPAQAGVPMQFDFRDVYGTMLQHWFQADQGRIRDYLFNDYQALDIFYASCVGSAENIPVTSEDIGLFPNPATTVINITSTNQSLAFQTVEVFNSIGSLMYKSVDPGQQFSIPLHNFASGQYHVRIRTERGFAVKTFVKM